MAPDVRQDTRSDAKAVGGNPIAGEDGAVEVSPQLGGASKFIAQVGPLPSSELEGKNRIFGVLRR